MDNREIKFLDGAEFAAFLEAWQDSDDKSIGAEMAERILITTAMLGKKTVELERLLICAVVAGAQKRGEWGAMLAVPKSALLSMPEGTLLKISETSMPPMVELRVHLPKKPIIIAQDFRRNGI